MNLFFVNVVLVNHADEDLLETYLFYGENNLKVGRAAEEKARELAKSVGCKALLDEATFDSHLEDGVIPCDPQRTIYITWPNPKRID